MVQRESYSIKRGDQPLNNPAGMLRTGTGPMHKDELLQIHQLLYGIRKCLTDANVIPAGSPAFAVYDAKGVLPQHVHRSKGDHRNAVFLLADALVIVSSHPNPEHAARLRERLAGFVRAA